MKKSILWITQGAIIAALYVVFTEFSTLLGLSSGVIQFRISEMFCILPIFTPAAIPGLAIGCVISNILAGGLPLDIVFGSLATLLGAIATYLLKKHKWIAFLCPVISNTLIIPFVLRFVYEVPDAMAFLFFTVFVGEFVCAYIVGWIFYRGIYKYADKIFQDPRLKVEPKEKAQESSSD